MKGAFSTFALLLAVGLLLSGCAETPVEEGSSLEGRDTARPTGQNLGVTGSNGQSDDNKYVLVEWALDSRGIDRETIWRPEEGRMFVAVYVRITNFGYPRVHVSSSSCSLICDGVEYPENSLFVRRSLPSVDLGNGASIYGYVGFEINDSHRQCGFKFDPVSFDDINVRYQKAW
jgi:hypothetical protein